MNNARGPLVLDFGNPIFSPTNRLHFESLILEVYHRLGTGAMSLCIHSVDPVDAPRSEILIIDN